MLNLPAAILAENRRANAAESALAALYIARRDAKAARVKWAAGAKAAGKCQRQDEPDGSHPSGGARGPCYVNRPLFGNEWCPACLAKQPLWVAYRYAVAKQTGALRKAMNAGKKIAEELEAATNG